MFYYANQMNFSRDYKKTDLSKPRLEIMYDHVSSSENKVDKEVFNSTTYAKVNQEGKIVLSQKFKNYELIDRREIYNQINKKK